MAMGQKFPEETKQAALAEMQNGATRASVAEKYGIAASTLTLWAKEASGETFPSMERKKSEKTKPGIGRRIPADIEERAIADFMKGHAHSVVTKKYKLSGSVGSRLKKLALERKASEERAAKRAKGKGGPKGARREVLNGHARLETPSEPPSDPLSSDERARLLFLERENKRLRAVVASYASEL